MDEVEPGRGGIVALPRGRRTVTDRLDAFQRRHPWAGFPLAVVYKFVDDQGSYLSALITYYGFLSVFPLLLLLSSVLGFVLQSQPDLQQQILDSALAQFPVIGTQLGDPAGLQGSARTVVVGFVTSLYGAMGVAQAGQNAMNVMWAVPRNDRPNPLLSRVRSLLLLGAAGLPVLVTVAVSALRSTAGDVVGPWLTVVSYLVSTLLLTAVLVLVLRLATARRCSVAEVLPGAVAAAVLIQVLQEFGSSYVGGVVAGAGALNGVFALVLGLVAWIYLQAVVVVLCVEVNVVRAKRLWPRALLTPFTDSVDLTRGDQRAYADLAAAQRQKGFERVETTFEHDGQNLSARRRRRAGR